MYLPLSSPDPIQAASVRLELQDLLVRTGLKERSRLLLGPFSCNTSLEAQWCRHSGSPGPKPGSPKLLLDLKGGLLQVCIPVALIQYSPFQDLSQSASALSRVHALINTSAFDWPWSPAKRTMRALSQQCCLLQFKRPLVHFYLLFGLICAGVMTEIIALGCSHSASRPTLVWWACGSEYNSTLSQVQRALDIFGVADPLQPAAHNGCYY